MQYDLGIDVRKQLIRKTMSAHEVAENFRSTLKQSILNGHMTIVNFDKTSPNLKSYTYATELFQPELIFDSEKFLNRDTKDYKKILAPSEDEDSSGNKGDYEIHDKFGMVFIADMSGEYADDVIVQSLLDRMPHSEKFSKYYI